MILHVLTLDSGAVLTGPDGGLATFTRPDAAQHAAATAAHGFPCRKVSVRMVDGDSADKRERKAYNAILEYNLPPAQKVARSEAVTGLKIACPW
jgi:hypothetical protein